MLNTNVDVEIKLIRMNIVVYHAALMKVFTSIESAVTLAEKKTIKILKIICIFFFFF